MCVLRDALRKVASCVSLLMLLPATVLAMQLPPEVQADRFVLQAERAMQEQDFVGAKAAMDAILELQTQHNLELPEEFSFRYAEVLERLGLYDEAIETVTRYLAAVGRDGQYYREALELLDVAEVKLSEQEAAELLAEAERALAERLQREREERARNVLADMQFVAIPAGQFTMGTDSRDVDSDQRPATEVQITRPFEIGRHEVTQAEWQAATGTNPSYFAECDRCPVERLTWDEIHQFISILNAVDGVTWSYRLPTEAEWEYAARAGSTADRYVSDIDASAWCEDNSDGRTHPVGLKRPNAFGLYDMLGNVQEVVQDWLGTYPGGTVVDPRGPSWPTLNYGLGNPDKVARGGNYYSSQNYCGFAPRGIFGMETDGGGGIRGLRFTGFRLVRTAP